MYKQYNISEYLNKSADSFSDKNAIFFRDKSITFNELNRLSDYYALELKKYGLKKGSGILLMLRPGIEFVAVVFGIFKAGALPVLIDPGMGRKNMLNCIKKTQPQALIGIPLAHFVRYISPSSFNSIESYFSVGKPFPGTKLLMNAHDFFDEYSNKMIRCDIEQCEYSDPAAIVFTTGSTGPPKGVVYTHGIYIKQMELISEVYNAGPDMFDMPAFPLFALFSAAMGMPCVIPDMNPSLPAQVDPNIIINTIKKYNVSFSFASPALWLKVCSFCKKNEITLPSLKKILMAGAPVSPQLHELILSIAPNAETMVPYGATEALPAANMTGGELTDTIAEKMKNGQGYCVGKPINSISIYIIKPEETELKEWNDVTLLPTGETGEIVIEGDIVTPEYFNLPEITALSKIRKGKKILHRMGDMGYFDESGYLWFKGRKTHRVFTSNGILYPVCCESIFNQHPQVRRSALIGIGECNNQVPVIIIEPEDGFLPSKNSERKKFISELMEFAGKYEFTSEIKKILFYTPFPVDIRHNAKIFREKLKVWAMKYKKYIEE